MAKTKEAMTLDEFHIWMIKGLVKNLKSKDLETVYNIVKRLNEK